MVKLKIFWPILGFLGVFGVIEKIDNYDMM